MTFQNRHRCADQKKVVFVVPNLYFHDLCKQKYTNKKGLSHKEKKKEKEWKYCVGEGNLINIFEFQIDDMAH